MWSKQEQQPVQTMVSAGKRKEAEIGMLPALLSLRHTWGGSQGNSAIYRGGKNHLTLQQPATSPHLQCAFYLSWFEIGAKIFSPLPNQSPTSVTESRGSYPVQ